MRLRREKIVFTQQDNAIVAGEDFARAQELADDLDPLILHKRLDRWARQFCPVEDVFPSGWHWSLLQVEYATDIIFRRPEDLAPLYETLTRRAIQEVKADDIATFLGRNGLSPLFEGEGGSRYNVLIEGTRLRHSLGAVREVLAAANRRYLEFLSVLEDDSSGRRDLDRVSRSVQDDAGRSYRGINFFLPADLDLALAIVRGEHLISGVTARKLRKRLPLWTSSQVSRAIRRLRELGLLRKIGGTFKYYITKLGQKVITAAMHVRENTIIPSMAFPIHA
jgi:hypothetical protein